MQNQSRIEMFKREKHLAVKKKLNFINFSEVQHNVINNQPITNNNTYNNNCNCSLSRVVYERP